MSMRAEKRRGHEEVEEDEAGGGTEEVWEWGKLDGRMDDEW